MLYKHYKGELYRVLHEGTHTETGEEMTVYMSVKNGKIWVRPTKMFHELVKVDNDHWLPRFREIHEDIRE